MIEDNTMNTQTQAQPLQIDQLVLDSLGQMTGAEDLQNLLQKAVPSAAIQDTGVRISLPFGREAWGQLVAGLETLYGLDGAYGLCIQTGQVFFNAYYRQYAQQTGFLEREFRMLPKPQRIQKGLELLSGAFNRILPGLEASVWEDETGWFWQVKDTAGLLAQATGAAFLQWFVIGVIQEFLSWTSGGKVYPVQAASRDNGAVPGMLLHIEKHYLG